MSNRVELVFGLVGPIGCPIHEAGEILASTLKKADYPLCQGSCPLLYFSLFFRWAG